MLKSTLNSILSHFGYEIVKSEQYKFESKIVDDPVFERIYAQCQAYTMTGKKRMYALYKATAFIAKNKIEGCFVECGVWRGGSAMLVAHTLLEFGDDQRDIYLYDTYEGMSAPSDADKDFRGVNASQMLDGADKFEGANVWCYADLNDVKNNLGSVGYPINRIHFIKGMVEETIPAQSPQSPIALLRLDTDWYESTKHELEHLFPQLVQSGVLIIDDYGHWAGCQKAVNEYFNGKKMLLNSVDYTGVIGQKTE